MLRRDDAENNMGMSATSNGMGSTQGTSFDKAKEKARNHFKNKIVVVDDVDK